MQLPCARSDRPWQIRGTWCGHVAWLATELRWPGLAAILEIGIARQAVSRAEIQLGNAIAAQTCRWFEDQYAMQAMADNGMCWEVHSVRSDVPSLQRHRGIVCLFSLLCPAPEGAPVLGWPVGIPAHLRPAAWEIVIPEGLC